MQTSKMIADKPIGATVKDKSFDHVQQVYQGKPFTTNVEFLEAMAQGGKIAKRAFGDQNSHSTHKRLDKNVNIDDFSSKFQYTTLYSLDYEPEKYKTIKKPSYIPYP